MDNTGRELEKAQKPKKVIAKKQRFRRHQPIPKLNRKDDALSFINYWRIIRMKHPDWSAEKIASIAMNSWYRLGKRKKMLYHLPTSQLKREFRESITDYEKKISGIVTRRLCFMNQMRKKRGKKGKVAKKSEPELSRKNFNKHVTRKMTLKLFG